MLLACSLACADAELLPDDMSDDERQAEALCPALPPGVEPISGLAVAHSYARFGGLVVTLSTRSLACDEPAVQHQRELGGDGRGLTVGLPQAYAGVGVHALGDPVHLEFETLTAINVGGGGELREASIELFEIDDDCVTGRVIGLTERGGPFDGGFRAPRCTP